MSRQNTAKNHVVRQAVTQLDTKENLMSHVVDVILKKCDQSNVTADKIFKEAYENHINTILSRINTDNPQVDASYNDIKSLIKNYRNKIQMKDLKDLSESERVTKAIKCYKDMIIKDSASNLSQIYKNEDLKNIAEIYLDKILKNTKSKCDLSDLKLNQNQSEAIITLRQKFGEDYPTFGKILKKTIDKLLEEEDKSTSCDANDYKKSILSQVIDNVSKDAGISNGKELCSAFINADGYAIPANKIKLTQYHINTLKLLLNSYDIRSLANIIDSIINKIDPYNSISSSAYENIFDNSLDYKKTVEKEVEQKIYKEPESYKKEKDEEECENHCESDIDCDDNNSCTKDICTEKGCKNIPVEKGAVCRIAKGDCDVYEVCDGEGNPCPEDKVRDEGFVCRVGSGDLCDSDEKCDGVSYTCPTDIVASKNTVCRESKGECDKEEKCTGKAGDACPEDKLKNQGIVCREGSGDICDPNEVCDGISYACPTDVVASKHTVCRESKGECDKEERCTGKAGYSCPEDKKSAAICRPAVDICDKEERCDQKNDHCPLDEFAPLNTPCRDGDNCTINDFCKEGECKPGHPIDCSALDDKCHIGICDSNTGSCKKEERSDKPCEDPCDTELCKHNSDCDDNNPCTKDICNTYTGQCTNSGSGVTVSCNDHDACTSHDICQGDIKGTCAGTPIMCDDGNVCTADTCDSKIGCVFLPLGSSTVCRTAAGDCDIEEVCRYGVCPEDKFKDSNTVCRMGSGDACDPEEKCTGIYPKCPVDIVETAKKVCRPSAGDCDIEEKCTGKAGEACPFDQKKPHGVVCRSGIGICDIEEVCDGISSACPEDEFKDSGTSCADSTICNGNEVCDGQGICTPGIPVECDDGNICTTDKCDDVLGCEYVDNNINCSDGDVCTIHDKCEKGECKPGQPIDCSALNDQCNIGVCDSYTGSCIAEAKPDGTLCDDNDPCTLDDQCKYGACSGTPKDCDDQIGCTEDSCDASGNCVNIANDTLCEDDCLCSTDKCVPEDANPGESGCVHECLPDCCKADSDCGSSDPCLVGSCDINTGRCSYDGSTTGGNSCDDKDKCTENDKCLGDKKGTCVGTPITCSDDNICTNDTCNPKVGCVFAPVASGTICRPAAGDCDLPERCDGTQNKCPADGFKPSHAVCRQGSADICDPDEKCTGDSAKCPDNIVEPATTVCRESKGDCDIAEKCTGNAGETCPVDKKSIDICREAKSFCDIEEKCDGQNNDCPTDLFKPAHTPCLDADVCNGDESCDGAGTCKEGISLDCEDNNSCTTEMCDPIKGCVVMNNESPCEDGDSCTTNDVCSDGICTSGNPVDCSHLDDQCNVGECQPGGGCAKVPKANGMSCEDGNACTVHDKCFEGTCSPGHLIDCSHLDDQCNVGECQPGGGCAKIPKANGSACSDSNLCTNDKCEYGKCISTPKDCNDKIFCTEDSCDSLTGACINTPSNANCDDNTICTNDKCYPLSPHAGKDGCIHTPIPECCKVDVDCKDTNICTVDTCNPQTGMCTNDGTGNFVKCDDHDICTVHDQCQGDEIGTCLGYPKSCDDHNICTDDSCDSNNLPHGCINTPNNFSRECYTGPNGSMNVGECQPGIETCAHGSLGPCIGEVTPKKEVCNSKDDDCDGVVDEGFNIGQVCTVGVGACERKGVFICNKDGTGTVCNVNPGTPNPELCNGKDDDCDGIIDEGELCDDEVDCTIDTCHGTHGCKNTPDNHSCQDDNPCTDNTCTLTGCESTNNNAPCDDSDLCTTNDTCDGGICKPGIPFDCSALDDECNVGVCDTNTGSCNKVARDDGTSCNDSDPCTLEDQCISGTCSGTPKDCNDGKSCTIDQCINGACLNIPNNMQCDDDCGCTEDKCAPNKPDSDEHGCVYMSIPGCCKKDEDCTDNNPCTKDTCNMETGKCTNDGTGTTVACDDQNACTENDICKGDIQGTCVGTPITCEDNSDCSVDSCNPAIGCIFTPLPAGTICRAAVSCGCDEAEVCDGTAAPCPEDQSKPKGTICRAAVGDCDEPEVCDGMNNACPDDALKPRGTVCREGSGDLCDPDEKCDGNTKLCPADVVTPKSIVCRASAGDCDIAEKCTGVPGESCPVDVLAPQGQVCREGSGDLCDPDESCDGTKANCPKDVIASSDTVCRPSIGECDPEEKCTGYRTEQCPDQVYLPDSTPCGDQTDNACTNPNTCQHGMCLDNHAPDGLSCDDGDACNGLEKCDGQGNCNPGTPKNCNDNIDCTVDDCDKKTGQCLNIPDHNQCQDNNDCSEDLCDLQLGCINDPISPCCGNGIIEKGEQCEPPNTENCDANCHNIVSCSKDKDCNDHVDCTTDRCKNGQCFNTEITSCKDDDGCCPTGCNARNDDDCCIGLGLGCDKDSSCCDPATCYNDLCCLGPNIDCSANSQCCSGTCHSHNSTCSFIPQGCKKDKDCDDNIACTKDDCKSGQCFNTFITSCKDNDGCCPTGCTSRNDDDCCVGFGMSCGKYDTCCEPASCNHGVCCFGSDIDCSANSQCCSGTCHSHNSTCSFA